MGKRTGKPRGRPPGARNKTTLSTEAAAAIAANMLPPEAKPLDVMLFAMQQAVQRGDMKAAVAVAEKAAPYVHAKLSSVDAQHSGPDGGPIQNDVTVRFV